MQKCKASTPSPYKNAIMSFWSNLFLPAPSQCTLPHPQVEILLLRRVYLQFELAMLADLILEAWHRALLTSGLLYDPLQIHLLRPC